MDISVRDVLRELRLKHGYQQNDVVKMLNDMDIETGAAQISRWENGHNNPNLLQFIGLCKIYGVKDVHKVFALRDFSDLIYELNKEGTAKLEEYKSLLIASGLYAPAPIKRKVVSFPRRTAPMYDFGASAGTGQYLDSDSYEMVELPEDAPDDVTFGLHVCGDSMEPTFEDGEAIWVHQQPTLENGEIGIFLVDGDSFVKEFRVDEKGAYLISHNNAYKPRKLIPTNEVKIFGKVVYPTR